MIRAYPIFQKSEAVFALRQHIVQYGAPRVLSSDNGGEFCSAAVDELRREFRILRHDCTVPENSHQNPAERAIQTANAAARKVFAVSNVREDMWPLALQMALTVVNLCPVGQCTHPGSSRSCPRTVCMNCSRRVWLTWR